MGAPPIGDNKINRLFFRISVFCIVSTSDSSVYHQLYQCLRSKMGKGGKLSDHKKQGLFRIDWWEGYKGVQGLRGLIIQIESSHFEGSVSFDLRARVLLRCHFVYDFVRLSTFHGRLVDWLLLAPPKRGGRGRLLLHIFNIIKKSADGGNLKERGRRVSYDMGKYGRNGWLTYRLCIIY